MMTGIIVGLSLGALLVVIGICLLLIPNQLSKLSQFLNRKIFDDNTILGHRVVTGIVCIGIGGLLLWSYIGHYLVK